MSLQCLIVGRLVDCRRFVSMQTQLLMDDYRSSEESQAFEACASTLTEKKTPSSAKWSTSNRYLFCRCLARRRRKEECRPWVRWARPIRGKWLQAEGCSATSISCLRDQLIRVSFEESSCAWCQLDSHRRADSLLRHPSHHLFLSRDVLSGKESSSSATRTTQNTSDWFDERTPRKKQSVSLLWLTRGVSSVDVQHLQREDLKIYSLPLSSIGAENVSVFSLTHSLSFCSLTFADACRLEHTWAQRTIFSMRRKILN